MPPGALIPLRPREATDAEILRFHTPAYLARVKAASAAPAGGQIGHELHTGHGFCVFSTVSLAAAAALETGRVIMLDKPAVLAAAKSAGISLFGFE